MTLVMTGFTPVELKNDETGGTNLTGLRESEATSRRAIEVRGRDAYFEPAAMQVGLGYAYWLDGTEFMAVRRVDGRVDVYALPDR